MINTSDDEGIHDKESIRSTIPETCPHVAAAKHVMLLYTGYCSEADCNMMSCFVQQYIFTHNTSYSYSTTTANDLFPQDLM